MMVWLWFSGVLAFAAVVYWALMNWRDARRYRWLREYQNHYFPEEKMLYGERLDEAIDAILAEDRVADDDVDDTVYDTASPELQPKYEYPHVAPMPGPQPLFGEADK